MYINVDLNYISTWTDAWLFAFNTGETLSIVNRIVHTISAAAEVTKSDMYPYRKGNK